MFYQAHGPHSPHAQKLPLKSQPAFTVIPFPASLPEIALSLQHVPARTIVVQFSVPLSCDSTEQKLLPTWEAFLLEGRGKESFWKWTFFFFVFIPFAHQNIDLNVQKEDDIWSQITWIVSVTVCDSGAINLNCLTSIATSIKQGNSDVSFTRMWWWLNEKSCFVIRNNK